MVKKTFTFKKHTLLVALAALAMMLTAQHAAAYSYTVLSGTGGTGNEGYPKLVDGDIQTKWGHSYVSGKTDAYVIFKSDRAIVPSNYFIIIANDTYAHPERNWLSWNVYAANFTSDEEAVRDASEWVLVDKKENEIVPNERFEAVDYTCTEGVTDAYTYFMVEVTAAVSSTDVWLQMSEFGWGTSYEFFYNGPISYVVMDGTRNNTDAEGLPKLFDGNYNTKFGNGFSAGEVIYAVFKTTRPVAPSYYCLVTGNDNERWNGRNWQTWSIFAMNTDNEAEVKRESDKWVLIDERVGVDKDVLPDLNFYEVYFTPNREITEAYSYFKIEIYAMQGGNVYSQMSEFFMGDAGSLESDAQKHYDRVAMDLSKPMQKSLADEYYAKIQGILTASDIFAVNRLTKECEEMQEAVRSSISAYDDYVNIVNQLRNHYENHTCITGDGRTIVGNYLDTEAGPSDTYPNGTYAYIIANGLLDVDGIGAEAIFVNMLMEKYASDLTEGAIDVEYEPFDGVAGFGNENYTNLVDGQDDTKWCSNAGNGGYWVTFRTSEPIMPTYYRLVTGNDTGNNPDRNWKSWKVYGANFDNDLDCVRESNAWVLLDEKNNIGSDQLPAANYATAFFYLSNPPAVPYEYFKIEISNPLGLMQMGEFTFQNGANFILARQDYYDEFVAYDIDNVVACQKYVEEYKKTLAKLQTTASIVDLSNLYNTLKSLQSDIATSEERYEDFEVALDEVRYAIDYMSPSAREYWEAFFDEDIEPNNEYQYGSYDYILNNLQIENAELSTFISYLYDVARAALEGGFCVIAGNMDTWGDKENYFKLVDKDYTTKWGGQIQAGGSWVIFYTMEPTQPLFYKLTTGNDTQAYWGRNWRDWKVYGGNFEKDSEATVDAEGWVLLDSREGVGQDRLPAENFYTVPFGFSEGVDEEYKYFMVVVTGAYDGSVVQMTEFEFGTEEEIEELREGYLAAVEDMSIDGIIATQSLIDTYEAAENAIYDEDDIEGIYQGYITMLSTYDKIQASAIIYARYQKAVADMREILATFEASDELNLLKSYLNDVVEAGDKFPNGSAATVIGKHLLDKDGLFAEIDYMNSLAKSALLKGYTVGADITAMIVNPSFGQGSTGWNGEVFASNYNADYSMSAAEFCNAQSTFDVHQTLTGLKNGYYLVGMNGGTRPANDRAGRNYAPMLYANGMVTYIKATIDDMIAHDEAVHGVNSWLRGEYPELPIIVDDDTLGYVLQGVQSCCQAFLAGRYQNFVVAEVTDGTLTFGVRNEGTQAGGDWTGLGNATITFLGDNIEGNAATVALDVVLDCEATIVHSLGIYEGFYELTDYKAHPYVCEAALQTLNSNMQAVKGGGASGAEKFAALVSNSDCFKEIYAAKNAYVKSIDAMQLVKGKWDSRTTLMSEDVLSGYNDAMWNILDGSMGVFTSAEALRAADDIKVSYPCYIDLDPNKMKGSLEIEETAPFEYVMNADGNHPNIALNNCMYDVLSDDQEILSLEYKCDQNLEGGLFYLAHPALNTDDTVDYGILPAATDGWRKVYFSLRNDYGWGEATNHWIRWDLAASGTFDISVRNAIIITKAQMEAEGGQTINDGIAPVFEDKDASKLGIYNVMGQRLTDPVKGINIIGGKKILVK